MAAMTFVLALLIIHVRRPLSQLTIMRRVMGPDRSMYKLYADLSLSPLLLVCLPSTRLKTQVNKPTYS